MISPQRREELDHRITERYLTSPAERAAFHNDPLFHLNVKMLRQLLTATEEAMAAEDIGEDARDRVTYRLLYGEAPESYAPPDFREAHNRMADRNAAIQRTLSEGLPKLPRTDEV